MSDHGHRLCDLLIVLSLRFFIGYWINTGPDVYPALFFNRAKGSMHYKVPG
jgi:hypothetical protein